METNYFFSLMKCR